MLRLCKLCHQVFGGPRPWFGGTATQPLCGRCYRHMLNQRRSYGLGQ
jgi:hypothetical protein